jgi:hypothetical protein
MSEQGKQRKVCGRAIAAIMRHSNPAQKNDKMQLDEIGRKRRG